MAKSAGNTLRVSKLAREKQGLRRAMRAALAALTPARRRRRSRLVFEKIIRDPAFRQAEKILLFVSMPEEVQTRPIIDWALKRSKTVVLPRVDCRKRLLQLRRIGDRRRDLEKGFRGILEPKKVCRLVSAGTIDCAVVPAMAFGGDLRRLGRGGGYYDRLLPGLKRAVKIGIGFSFQRRKKIPAAAKDRKVDRVITG